ncbi:hypothetical protein [Heyndrickxia coagulans]|uniref:hypothetical protein n=1 Tax=Heyndrickxia coagulans TaxID=1398 RepID=UPI000381162F|nr:hypothetical protein [Heyndrickxia coagulans]
MDIQSQCKKGIFAEGFNIVIITFSLAKQANIGFGYISIGTDGISGNIRESIGI